MNEQKTLDVLHSIRRECEVVAEREMTDRLDRLRSLASELVGSLPEIERGRRFNVEDVLNAAAQGSGLTHPATLAAMAARADQLVSQFVAETISRVVDTDAEIYKPRRGRPPKVQESVQ